MWSAQDGLDPFAIAGFLFHHPAATVVGLCVAVFAAYAASTWIFLQGAQGRAGATRVDRELPGAREEALARILSTDPDFDEAAFLRRASGAFAEIQAARTRQDMSWSRGFVSDGVAERFRRQFAEDRERGLRRRLTDARLDEVQAVGFTAGAHFDAAYVSFAGEIHDELVALDGGGSVSGGRRPLNEIWTFLRRPGAKTLARPGLLEGSCPSCGAPLKIADAAECPACKAWVNSGEHDWVLAGITQFKAWAFPDKARDIDGYDSMLMADPALSLESLEDRAAAVFWRWLDARRRADAAPLRGVAGDEYLSRLRLGDTFDASAELLGVEPEVFERGEGFDRVHIRVRWESETMKRDVFDSYEPESRGERDSFFIFRRRSDARSETRRGLTAARCPSCGAPPDSADPTVCAYCGRPFNDGSSWLLSDVVPFGLWRRPAAWTGTGPI